jgi:hypothetical protein
MSIHKDFSDFEKKLDLGLGLPNAQGVSQNIKGVAQLPFEHFK